MLAGCLLFIIAIALLSIFPKFLIGLLIVALVYIIFFDKPLTDSTEDMLQKHKKSKKDSIVAISVLLVIGIGVVIVQNGNKDNSFENDIASKDVDKTNDDAFDKASKENNSDSTSIETSDNSESKEADASSESSISDTNSDTKDITLLNNEPTSKQKIVLDVLTKQQFQEQFPYKKSKIHTITGVLQDWTVVNDKWFYKAEATINNAYDAKRDATIEVTITPTGPETGSVEIIDY